MQILIKWHTYLPAVTELAVSNSFMPLINKLKKQNKLTFNSSTASHLLQRNINHAQSHHMVVT